MKLGALAEPILVGRERELKELKRYLESAVEGKGTTIFISGEAGSGKTRLATELLKEATAKGLTVLSGWCLSNMAVPYFPFLEAFESLQSSNEVSATQQLKATNLLTNQLPTPAEKPFLFNSQSWKDQAYAGIMKELLDISTKKPVVLFVDDLQWADSASLALFHYITQEISGERILVLATFRSEEVQAKLDGRAHPLLEALQLMGREGLRTEIHLSNLKAKDVSLIAENMLGNRVDHGIAEKLTVETGGNPLFVVELIRMIFENGSLVNNQGRWALAIDGLCIPDKIRDVISRRLDFLKPAQRRILDISSVIGEKFNPRLVAEALSQENLDVLEALNQVQQATNIVRADGDIYQFEHAKVQEMLYDAIPQLMKKELHMLVARKMEATAEYSSGDIAFHYVKAQNKEKAIHYSLAAGKDALSKFSNVEAIKYFDFVNQTVGIDNKFLVEKEIAQEGLGDAFFANSMFREATEQFESLAEERRDVVGLRALRKAMDAAFFLYDSASLMRLIKKAEEYPELDRLEKARILVNQGRFLILTDPPASSLAIYEAALKVFEEEYSFRDTAWALIGVGIRQAFQGRLEDGLASCLRSIRFFEDLGDARWLMEAYSNAGIILGEYFGFPKEAIAMYERALKINKEEKLNDYSTVAKVHAEWAWALMLEDNTKGAVDKTLEALAYAEKTDSEWAKGYVYSNLTLYYALLGEKKSLKESFEKLLQLPVTVRNNPFIQFPIATAFVYTQSDQWDNAVEAFKGFQLFMSSAQIAPALEASFRLWYSRALNLHGLINEAEANQSEARRIYEIVAERFSHGNLRLNLMAPIEVITNKSFEARIDMTNVSRVTCTPKKILYTTPAEVKILAASKNCRINSGFIELKKPVLAAFTSEPITLTLSNSKSGKFSLHFKIIYENDLMEQKTVETRPIAITAIAEPPTPVQRIDTTNMVVVSKSLAAERAFDFLLNAFIQDYMRKKLPLIDCGWVTLVQLKEKSGLSKHEVYGMHGHTGKTVAELERSNLVEARIFSGERGRGGRIMKLRVDYEKEAVKSLIGKKLLKK